ncbi:hypothetical protein BSZ35_19065 [Salinibacter sp. 10B]|uniref:hypothetical protein n=1 Tax=Salinibacter sp. 10B TaxID=1923971 RepID=UPI000CF4FC49|nr:hypothetical protein [Salinibacter sp. 10B]PQJ26750.1 hypothetical protein BSZ35_19065 [Salinibacter sp. 10B]
MVVIVTFESESGEFHEHQYDGVPENIVDEIIDDHNDRLNGGDTERAQSYSYDRSNDGKTGKISLDLDRVDSISSFDRSSPDFKGAYRG